MSAQRSEGLKKGFPGSKDKADFGKAPVVVAGRGVVDVAACFEELDKQNFNGHISIEHEADWDDSIPQVRANIDFAKAHKRTGATVTK